MTETLALSVISDRIEALLTDEGVKIRLADICKASGKQVAADWLVNVAIATLLYGKGAETE